MLGRIDTPGAIGVEGLVDVAGKIGDQVWMWPPRCAKTFQFMCFTIALVHPTLFCLHFLEVGYI